MTKGRTEPPKPTNRLRFASDAMTYDKWKLGEDFLNRQLRMSHKYKRMFFQLRRRVQPKVGPVANQRWRDDSPKATNGFVLHSHPNHRRALKK